MANFNYYNDAELSEKDEQRIAAICETLSERQIEAVEAMNQFYGSYEPSEEMNLMIQADEIPYVQFPDCYKFMNDDKKIGYYIFDNGLGPESLQSLYDEGKYAGYIDVEAYGRDVRLNGDMVATSQGVIEAYADMPDINRYSEEDIDEWIECNA